MFRLLSLGILSSRSAIAGGRGGVEKRRGFLVICYSGGGVQEDFGLLGVGVRGGGLGDEEGVVDEAVVEVAVGFLLTLGVLLPVGCVFVG